eukprot:scaffold3105_cov135-Skeletonema_dohrnii-CCMP3373.AAC.4
MKYQSSIIEHYKADNKGYERERQSRGKLAERRFCFFSGSRERVGAGKITPASWLSVTFSTLTFLQTVEHREKNKTLGKWQFI